jgi:hypothetical protein
MPVHYHLADDNPECLEGQSLNYENDSQQNMATQGVWLHAELCYIWLSWYYVIFLVLGFAVVAGIYGLASASYGWGIIIGLPVALILLFALAIYYFLFYPLQCEVSFERGHVFYRGKGVRGSRNTRATYVKPLRAIRVGLVVSVNSHIRGFRLKFQNDQDATLFLDWCRGSGVPILQSAP